MCETDPQHSDMHEVNIPIDLDVVNITYIKLSNIKQANTEVFLPTYLVCFFFYSCSSFFCNQFQTDSKFTNMNVYPFPYSNLEAKSIINVHGKMVSDR